MKKAAYFSEKHFFRKKVAKNFVSSKNLRTFALANKKQGRLAQLV